MNEQAAAALSARLQLDSYADVGSLRTATDKTLSVGQDVWRLRWRDQPTTAVATDADLHTTCGALLDALALLETEVARPSDSWRSLDLTAVNVLIDRPLPGENPSESDQAVRSMRDSVQGVAARIWYQCEEDGWTEDTAPAPTWPADDPRVTRWVSNLMVPRLTAHPSGLVVELVRAVDDPSLHLYPSEITATKSNVWALRLDGLQVGTASSTRATLTIGKPGKVADGTQRKAFIAVFGQPSVQVTGATSLAPGEISIDAAAIGLRALLRRFREADVRGAPITHRESGGVRLVDEHTLEARFLKGLIRLPNDGGRLVLDDGDVARGSQFPTLWGNSTQPRYLDALLRHGTTPLAFELKVARGGQGRYYRRSVVQAVLYRHFMHNAPDLDPWFGTAGLAREDTYACVGIPTPSRWTASFGDSLDLLQRVAARVGAAVYVLDDRATPDYVARLGLTEPPEDQVELLSWQLAAALTRRWPISLGRVLEMHGGGGLYDQIELRAKTDRTLSPPWPRPRVSLNRPGSAWVFSQTGSSRWTWREIWSHLAAGGDADDAAATIGAIAGLGTEEPAAGPSFAEIAAAFLERTNGVRWSWRCAWGADGGDPEWLDRYRPPLRRYDRRETAGVPTIARIWALVRNGHAAVVVDQQNLRTWIATADGSSRELTDSDPLRRMSEAAGLLLE